jgi:hypothetical protein
MEMETYNATKRWEFVYNHMKSNAHKNSNLETFALICEKSSMLVNRDYHTKDPVRIIKEQLKEDFCPIMAKVYMTYDITDYKMVFERYSNFIENLHIDLPPLDIPYEEVIENWNFFKQRPKMQEIFVSNIKKLIRKEKLEKINKM